MDDKSRALDENDLHWRLQMARMTRSPSSDLPEHAFRRGSIVILEHVGAGYWYVYDEGYQDLLGSIHWSDGIREYTFTPATTLVYTASLMRDISDFIQELGNGRQD